MKRLFSNLTVLLLIFCISLSGCSGTDADQALPSMESVEAVSPSPSVTVSPSSSPAAAEYEGDVIVREALEFEGGKYVYGGYSPETGFDCSGMIYYLYRQHGYRLNRVAADQATNGVHIEREELLPGDIVCFSRGSRVNHVGLYIGDNRFIHAQDSETGVVITDLDEWLSVGRKLECRRILGHVEKKTLEEIEREEEEEAALREQATPEPTPTEAPPVQTETPAPTETPVPTETPEPTEQDLIDQYEKERSEVLEEIEEIREGGGVVISIYD